MLVCRRGQSLEFVDVTIARRSPRRHTASFFQPAGHTLQSKTHERESAESVFLWNGPVRFEARTRRVIRC